MNGINIIHRSFTKLSDCTDQHESCFSRCELCHHPLVVVGTPNAEPVARLQTCAQQTRRHRGRLKRKNCIAVHIFANKNWYSSYRIYISTCRKIFLPWPLFYSFLLVIASINSVLSCNSRLCWVAGMFSWRFGAPTQRLLCPRREPPPCPASVQQSSQEGLSPPWLRGNSIPGALAGARGVSLKTLPAGQQLKEHWNRHFGWCGEEVVTWRDWWDVVCYGGEETPVWRGKEVKLNVLDMKMLLE